MAELNPDEQAEIGKLIASTWGVRLGDFESASWNKLRETLSEAISELLKDDFGRLVGIMYRLDIPEKQFFEALETAQGDPAVRVADLVLERELKRLEFRKKYRRKGEGNP